MTSPADLWERCPVCRARLQADSVECRRCKMDFSGLLHHVERAQKRAGRARELLREGSFNASFLEALNACLEHVSEETLRSLSMAALAQRNFPMALGLWQELKKRSGGQDTEEG